MEAYSPYRAQEQQGMLITMVKSEQIPRSSLAFKMEGHIHYTYFKNGEKRERHPVLPEGVKLQGEPWHIKGGNGVYAVYTSVSHVHDDTAVLFHIPVIVQSSDRFIDRELEGLLIRDLQQMGQAARDRLQQPRVFEAYMRAPSSLLTLLFSSQSGVKKP